MTKYKRIISLVGLDINFTRVFTSYCQLLKPQLDDAWIVNKLNKYSEIVVVDHEHKIKRTKNIKVKIILGSSINKNMESNKQGVAVFNLQYPINSTKIVKILNKVSRLKELQKFNVSSYVKTTFLMNILSKFIPKRQKVQKDIVNVKNQKTQIVAKKLLKLHNPNYNKILKVVFLGRPGSGKTTAVKSACTNKVLTSEVMATDSVGLLKNQTTIGIDYGECELEDGVKLKVYGTPGQKRYDYVQSQTVSKSDIYVILIDLSSVAPFAEFIYYKNIIAKSGNHHALMVVAFTHYDLKEHNMAQLSKEIRYKCHGEMLTMKIDTRQKDEVRFMLEKISEMIINKVPSEKYYNENSLFLKDINAQQKNYVQDLILSS